MCYDLLPLWTVGWSYLDYLAVYIISSVIRQLDIKCQWYLLLLTCSCNHLQHCHKP